MPGRTSWRSAWLLFACWIAVIFGLSSVPDLSPPQVGIPMADKLAHLGEYGVLGALLARARPGRRSAARTLLAGLILGSVVGALDEAYQSGTPGREVSARDALADAIGAAGGGLAWAYFAARRRRAGAPPETPASR
jgi:VanZ family protein